jgi:F-type H+-transporting ATPase subunit delta
VTDALSTAMRGASAASLGTLAEALDQAVAAGADTERVADDLFGVAAVLDREPGLRRVLTDISVDPPAREQLVRRVFEGRLDPVSVDLVAKGATMRWAATRDLADACERLGVVSLVRGAERSGEADALQDDLFGIGRLVKENPELRDALADPARSVADKRALVSGLLEGKATPGALRLAEQALSGSHRTVVGAIEEYQDLAASSRRLIVATVRVARPLPDADRERLEKSLTAKYARPVHTNLVVDPDLLGGIRVEIGDDVIDGTIVSRLDEARRRLAG